MHTAERLGSGQGRSHRACDADARGTCLRNAARGGASPGDVKGVGEAACGCRCARRRSRYRSYLYTRSCNCMAWGGRDGGVTAGAAWATRRAALRYDLPPHVLAAALAARHSHTARMSTRHVPLGSEDRMVSQRTAVTRDGANATEQRSHVTPMCHDQIAGAPPPGREIRASEAYSSPW